MALKRQVKKFIDRDIRLWKLKRSIKRRMFDIRDRFKGKPNWFYAPQDIQIDTHNYCSSTHDYNEEGNLYHAYEGCVFCNVKEGGAFKIPRGRMDDDLLWYIIDYWGKYKHLGVENICPYVNGDPIIDDRMPEICDRSQINGLKVVVDTSGNVFRNRDYLIHPNLTLLRFSMSATDKEIYEKVQGCPKFEEVVATIDYVLDNKFPSQTVEMHFMVNKYNEHQIDEYVDWFNKDLGLKVKIFPLHEMPDIQLNSTASLPSDQWRNRGETLREWEASRPIFIYPNGHTERQIMRNNRTCQGMAYAVQWDGLILHCTDAPPDYETYPNGDINPFHLGYVKADGFGRDMLDAWHQRNNQRINHAGCRACNARRPDWWKILKKYDMATYEETRDYLQWRREIA